jgi:hypothetical protein
VLRGLKRASHQGDKSAMERGLREVINKPTVGMSQMATRISIAILLPKFIFLIKCITLFIAATPVV